MRRIQRDLDLEAMLLETDETAGETADRYVTRDRHNNISVSVAWSASLWLAACSEDSPDGGRRKLR